MAVSEDNTQPIVVTLKKEQTLEQAIRLTKVEYSNPLELIEKIENEEKTIQKKADLDSQKRRKGANGSLYLEYF